MTGSLSNGIQIDAEARSPTKHRHHQPQSQPGLLKHILHCILMTTFMLISVVTFLYREPGISPLWGKFSNVPAYLIYTIRYLSVFISLPYEIFILLGLFLYNAFPGPVELKNEDMTTYPMICFRVTTKGESQNLVRNTVRRNLKLISKSGLRAFKVQILTNIFISGIPSHAKVEQVVVPESYETKTGAMYKARSLQYVIEHDALNDRDWLVHLDEETILTPNSVKGILNFINEGKSDIGQGLITYANDGPVVNWVTTLADATRLTDDMGKIRAQFNLFNRPLFSMKGAYTVLQVGTEAKVGYDNGRAGSIAEDCFFVMKAYDQGFSFGFIQGEMWEFSPFTIWDFVLQRKRWFQGILLVVYSGAMSLRTMVWLTIDFHNHFFQPLSTIFMMTDMWELLPTPVWFQVLGLLGYGLRLYMYTFGILKTAECDLRPGEWRPMKLFCLTLFTIIIVRPIHVFMDIFAMTLGLWQSKYGFYLVKKEI